MAAEWKEKIARSYYLKHFWKGRPGGVNHPVFGEPVRYYTCQKCGKRAEFISKRDGKIEYCLCRECYRDRIKGREEGKPPKKNQRAIKGLKK